MWQCLPGNDWTKLSRSHHHHEGVIINLLYTSFNVLRSLDPITALLFKQEDLCQVQS